MIYKVIIISNLKKGNLKYLLVPAVLLVFGCSQLKYKKSIQTKLPELATIGVFEKYPLGDVASSKSVPVLSVPIRVKMELSDVKERQWYSLVKNDTVSKRLDSTLVSFTILDQFGLINQVNENKSLVEFLKSREEFKIITGVEMFFQEEVLNSLNKSEEVFLSTKRNGILSFDLKKDNKIFKQLEFTEGSIVEFTASNFCWGTPKGYKVKIIDLVENGKGCGENGYLSFKRAQNKTEIKF